MRRLQRPSYFAGGALRGINTLLLQLEMQTFLMVLIGSVGFGSIWFFLNMSMLEIGDVFGHMAAWICVHWLNWPEQSIPIKMDSGWQPLRASSVLQTGYVTASVANATQHALIAAGIASAMFISLLYFVMQFGRRHHHNARSDSVVRGTPIATPRELKRAVRKADASNIRICDIPLPEAALNRNILLLGSTRSGKSLSIRRILREVERRGDMAIVFDRVGDSVSEFYKPDRLDLLMNPLDRRAAPWSPWCEGNTPMDFMRIAQSLLPKRPNDENTFTQEGARILLVALLNQMGKIENPSIENFLDVAQRWDLERKVKFLKRNEATKRFIGDSDAGHNVDATLGTITQMLRYLQRGSGSGKDRSIQSFIRDIVRIKEEGPEGLLAELDNIDPVAGAFFSGTHSKYADPIGQHRRDEITALTRVINTGRTPWMFISVEPEKMDVLTPLLACWIDLAVTSVLSLRPREDRRVWIILDEWHALGKLTCLPDILTDGVKYGASVVAGTQNLGQIRENYGADAAKAMLSLFNTKAIFRLPEPVSAEWASQHMEDLISKRRCGASIASGRVVERAVVSHEFIELPDNTAYLSIAGDFPVAKVATTFKPKTDPARELKPAFVPRTFEELAWSHVKPLPASRAAADTERASISKRKVDPRTNRDHPFTPGRQGTNSDPDFQMRHRDLPSSGKNDATPKRSSAPTHPATLPDSAKDTEKSPQGHAPQSSSKTPKNPAEQFNPLDRQSLIKEIRTLSEEGLSIREIARQLNVSKSMVHRLLSDKS